MVFLASKVQGSVRSGGFEDAAQAHTVNPKPFGLLHFPQPKQGRGS